MTQQVIVTTPVNSGQGTPLNSAFNEVNANFTELYNPRNLTNSAVSVNATDAVAVDQGAGAVKATIAQVAVQVAAESTPISSLAAGSTLTGTEAVPVLQGSAVVQVTTQSIANLAGASSGLTPGNIQGGTDRVTLLNNDLIPVAQNAGGGILYKATMTEVNANVVGQGVQLTALTAGTNLGANDAILAVQAVSGTCTLSIASPCVVTYANSFVANQPVSFTTTGALPTGLTGGTTYYVSATGLSGSSFQVSATQGGASINTSGSQSGVQTVTAPTNPRACTGAQIAAGVVAQGTTVNAGIVAQTDRATLQGTDAFFVTDSAGVTLYKGTIAEIAAALSTYVQNVGPQYANSGASVTMSAGVKKLILDSGVGATFAVTLPVPLGDGHEVYINAAVAIGTAFNCTYQAPATAIKAAPGTMAAGQGIGYVYRAANTTWYRLY
jgi:hypothetical protein